MQKIRILENTVQEYSWGSKTAIPELLGREPNGKPQAELWMGAHPKAPSQVVDGGSYIPLNEFIESDPVGILGDSVSSSFENKLPFLFKILAAGAPLSIQAHPNKAQAIEGFNRENSAGIPLDSPVRNYRDDNHKPEMIVALTPFWALNGFRNFHDCGILMEKLWGGTFFKESNPLPKEFSNIAIKGFFESIMNGDITDGNLRKDAEQEGQDPMLTKIRTMADFQPEFQWMLKLDEFYPGDPGILAPLFLNLVHLQPGEAMFLKAGDLHTYLDGLGIELMANSDNVLRGGLTPKHIDLPELMKVVNFEEKEIEILSPDEINSTEKKYPTYADEFSLSVLNISEGNSYRSLSGRCVEIMICTDGKATVTDSSQQLEIVRGTSFIVPASVSAYSISGNAILFKATVPKNAACHQFKEDV
ncbi:MAG: mannose-6-phosphate isomerase, class I [bacterium]